MLTFDQRVTNIEAALSIIKLKLDASINDGTLDATNDELGAVLEEVFGGLKDIRDRYNILLNQKQMVEQIINPATRK